VLINLRYLWRLYWWLCAREDAYIEKLAGGKYFDRRFIERSHPHD
jgi:hypothetical protein